MSTLKKFHTFRELQGVDREPIDFEWMIFPGAIALDLLHEIQADLQGKHVTPENFSDRINIHVNVQRHCSGKRKLNWRFLCCCFKEDQRVCLNIFFDGHWAFLGTRRRKQVVIKDMQPMMVASGIFVLHQWWKISRNSGHPVFLGMSPLGRGLLKKKSVRDTIHFNGEYWNIDLAVQDDSFRESSLYLRSSHKLVWNKFWRGQVKADPKSARKTSPENQIKTGGSWVIGWYSKTTACFGKPNAPEFDRFQFRCHSWAKLNISGQWRNSTIRSREEIVMLQLLLLILDGENRTSNVQRIHSTQEKSEGFKAITHQLMQTKKLVQS